jgi:hypothetical protein
MDLSILIALQDSPVELEQFLKITSNRFKPVISMLTHQQLTDLAAAFAMRTNHKVIYVTICEELNRRIGKTIESSNPTQQWEEAEKGYDPNQTF